MAQNSGFKYEFNPFAAPNFLKGGKSRPPSNTIEPRIRFAPKARNFMLDIVANPCARPWYVYVETFVPAFINMLLTVAILDLSDWFRRASVESLDVDTRTQRQRVGGGHFVKWNVPDEPDAARKVSRLGLATVLKVTMPLEIIGFSYLLYSQTDKFYYNWGTLLSEQPFCQNAPITGPLSRTDPPSQVLTSPTGQGFGYNTLEQNRAGWFTSPLTAVVTARLIDVVATIRVKRNFSTLQGVRLGVSIRFGGDPKVFLSPPVDVGTEQFVDLVVRGQRNQSNDFPAGVEWFLVGPASGTGLQVESGDVFINARNA